jgi:CPA1 family monovalent cation:H+ antiporter
VTLPQWMLVVSGLLALSVVLGVVARRVRMPLSAVLAVVGFFGGWAGGMMGLRAPLQGEAFELVVTFLFLPVLVFEASLGLSTRSFFRNLGPILVLAVPALLVSTALVGLALRFGLGVPLTAALLFGALISATDPVAVVVIFRQLGVPRRLLTLVEGESLLNDGVAIVLFNILLAGALGGAVSVGGGVLSFVRVFFGGLLIGALVGIAAGLLLPWLARLPAAALTLAVAYGGFVLADHVLGFSGVTANVASGLVLSGLAPSRAAAAVRELWHELWQSLGYVANGLLFLLIGLAIDPRLVADYWRATVLAVGVVLLSRALAVVPLVSALERASGIPPMGLRNQAVLIWGGLRGGVALALALSLPEELPQQELFVAMAGGVVLTTLLLNATTIGPLVRRLGLDRPSRADRFLIGSAHLSGVVAARARLENLGMEDPEVNAALEAAERRCRRDLEGIRLTPEEELRVVTGRGLFLERETYQRLSDAGMLPPAAARTLLDEVDAQIEEFSLDRPALESVRKRKAPWLDRLLEMIAAHLPGPIGGTAGGIAYAEASARRLAARRTAEALELFDRLPNISEESVRDARRTFAEWEQRAIASLAELGERPDLNAAELRRRQAEEMSRISSEEALMELARLGLIPESAAARAVGAITSEVQEPVH